MAAGRHLGFSNFPFMMTVPIFCYALGYAVQISAKKLNPSGSY